MNQKKWIYEVTDPDLKGLFSKIEDLINVRHKVSEDLIQQAQIVREIALKNGKLLKSLLNSRTET